jgi:REP element-mobilizing transposase RayT
MTSLFINRYRRESIRRKGFDYSLPGSYYFTICTDNREHLFGKIMPSFDPGNNVLSKVMVLNEAGKIVADCWKDLPDHYENIRLDAFVVMPDHVHGIIIIENPIDEKKHHGLPEFIRALKSFSSRRIAKAMKTPDMKVWQTDYYERLINSHEDLEKTRNYIIQNPNNWGNKHNKHDL